MKDTERAPDRVTPVLHAIAGIALVVMMLVVVGDVVLRAVFNTPIVGAYDVVSICLLVLTLFGMVPVVARRGEILIDIIDFLMPPAGLRLLSVLAAVGGIAIFLFFGWSMVQPALEAWQWGERSLELGIPKWPLWVVAFLGLVGILFAYGVQLRAALRSRPEPPPEEHGA